MTTLTPEDLLVGADATYDIMVPPDILRPDDSGTENEEGLWVQLRPLTIGKFQLILKAARDDSSLIPLLMVKESLVEPTLSLEEVKKLRLGLVKFLIEHIRNLSGLTEKKIIRISFLAAGANQLSVGACFWLDSGSRPKTDDGTGEALFGIVR